MSWCEYVVSLALVIVWNFVRFSSAEGTIVTLPKLGVVQGRITETAWTNREVIQFLDVKYAEAPSGERRFKPPIPVKAWDDVYDATTERLGCPSILTLSSSQRADGDADLEDCLTMTITTPNVTGSFPVLVYIHGEYLYEGSNMEAPPDYLLEKDIVLVAPQYRLGPFGFLSTKTEEVPGNAGVMDVYLALQFIKIFIQNFGGDPKRVTLAGQVGGAAIVHLLTLSPIVEPGLFQQVIYHSGSAIMPVFLDESPRPHALDIAKKSGCVNMHTVKHLNECLMKVPTRQLLTGFMEHAQEHSFNGTGNTGGVQFTIGGPSPVLPAHPSVLMAEASNFTYPAMGGCPRNAGTRLLSEIVENDFEDRIPDDMYNSFDYINHVMRQVVGQDKNMLLTSFAMHDFFNRNLLENGTFKALIPRLVDMAGTMLHKLPVLLALNMNGKHLPDKTFLYSFDYRGEFNRYAELDEETNNQSPFRAGVSLTDEALYLFPYPDHVDNLSPTDEEMARRMVDLWTSFVINGNPMASHRGGYWPPMTTLYGPYMKIDETMTIAGNYFNEFSATVNDEERGIRLVRDDLYYKRKRIFG